MSGADTTLRSEASSCDDACDDEFESDEEEEDALEEPAWGKGMSST